MAGFASVVAEITRCLDQADAEVILPEAVDNYPGEERIIRPGDPLGKLDASLAIVCISFQLEVRSTWNGSHAARRYLGPLVLHIAPMQHVGRVRLLADHGEDLFRWGWGR